MTMSSSGRKPLSQEWKDGFLAAHKSLNDMKERSGEDLAIYALAEAGAIGERQLGYFRFGVGQDGMHWHRYKWTAGPLAGRYTFGSGPSIESSLARCCAAVHEVEAGKRKAHSDTGYRTKQPK